MSPFIFASIATILCGPLSDYVARRFSKANGGMSVFMFTLCEALNMVRYLGIFEPEFRLVLVSFYAVFGCMGFFGWG